MTQISEEINYKEAYEKEHLKSAQLASRVAELEEKNEKNVWIAPKKQTNSFIYVWRFLPASVRRWWQTSCKSVK